MDLGAAVGIALAGGCAVATSLAGLCAGRGVRGVVAVDVRRPVRTVRALLRSRWFLVGAALSNLAFLLHVGALALVPLSLVQAILAGSVVICALLASWLFELPVGRRQWCGVCLGAGGLFLLALTLPALEGGTPLPDPQAVAGFEATLAAAAAVTAFRVRRGVALGAAGGMLFAFVDVAIKQATALAGHGGGLPVVAAWGAAVVLGSLGAQLCVLRGLQEADAVPVIALVSFGSNSVSILAGFLVFHDPLPAGTIELAAGALALAAVCAAALLTPAPGAARPLRSAR